MLSKISIVCFASSYTVVLLLELSRLLFRSGIRGAIMMGFAGAGLLAHTCFLYYQAVLATGSPLSSAQDWYLVAAWLLVAVYLYLTYFHPKTPFGLFLLPLVLGLIATARFVADRQPFAREPASRIWGMIHGWSLLLAVVATFVGFATGLMYLEQARRLKHKTPPGRGLRLPSLEWLHVANGRSLVVSVLMLGIGFLSGVILNSIPGVQPSERLSWGDPTVLSTLIVWLLMCAAGWFYRPSREGHRVAYLTLVSFLFLIIALSMGLFLRTGHGHKSGGGANLDVRPRTADRQSPRC
jgi:hypothetical protein